MSAVKNEARTNRDTIFHERTVVNEYAVREGDKFCDSVGDSVVERVVHFGAFDYAVGAGREAYGTQNPEQKCFHDEIKRLETMPVRGDRRMRGTR